MVTSLYLFFMANWCLSYNEITLLPTLFCKCCQKIPHEAVYLDIIQGLCLNVSSSIFILALFLEITPRASRSEDMWKTISRGSSKPLDKLCNGSFYSVALQFHSFGLGEGWASSGENLDSFDVHSISEVVLLSLKLTGPWEIKECALLWWGKSAMWELQVSSGRLMSVPTECYAVSGEEIRTSKAVVMGRGCLLKKMWPNEFNDFHLRGSIVETSNLNIYNEYLSPEIGKWITTLPSCSFLYSIGLR